MKIWKVPSETSFVEPLAEVTAGDSFVGLQMGRFHISLTPVEAVAFAVALESAATEARRLHTLELRRLGGITRI